jgi:hypothetical protein
MMSKRSRVLLCAALAGALGLSACGGDDSVTAVNTAASDLSTIDSISTDSSDSTTPDSSESVAVTDTGGSGVVSELCGNGAAFVAALGGGGGLGSGTGDLGDIAKNLVGLKDSLPEELRDDAQTMATFWEGYAKLLSKYGNDMSKMIAAATSDSEVAKAMANLTTPELTAAANNLAEYFSNNCALN